MRNLRNIHRSVVRRPGTRPIAASAWDVNGEGSIICAFGPTKDNVLLELKRWKHYESSWEPIASWDAACPLPDLECDQIIDLHYFPDTFSSVLVLAGGDLVVVRESPTLGEDKIEIVGSVNAGISAASWSPDEELLAISTKLSTLLYMTREFDNVVSLEMTGDDFKVSDHVSVGWGKKETQFKGKRARALRDPTVPETVDEGVLHPSDAGQTTISWRGDGAYVAINSIQDVRRVIRVYSREGVLDSVSEPVDNLMHALSWRPAGNLIAGVQCLESEIKVIFFEKNGLRHGDFNLRTNAEEVKSWVAEINLKWNVDSSVLAVCFKDGVQLWQMGNHHYYLKQELLCASKVSWHPEKALHLTIQDEAVLQRLAYATVVSGTNTSPPHDHGIAAVIDGKLLKLTPLRYANVPPPMALSEVSVEDNITDVSILGEEDAGQTRFAILHQGTVSQFLWDLQSPPILVRQTYLADMKTNPYSMALQSAFGSHGYLFVLRSSVESVDIDRLVGNDVVTIKQQWPLEVLVPRQQSDYHSELSVMLNNRFSKEQTVLIHGIGIEYCPISTLTVDSTKSAFGPVLDDKESTGSQVNGFKSLNNAIFRLDEQGTLFANNSRVASNCTSFLVTPAHLLFTSKNLLKFVHLAGNVTDLEVPPDTPESDERCRSIERGGKLVTVMPSVFAVVLQMPRGNLETIYPRALVLAGIRDNIGCKRYRTAFLACRNHRVDMNILHDHNPQQFLADVDLFIDKVNKPEHIDLFLSQLRNEDVTKTMYRETLRPVEKEWSPKDIAVPYGSKVNRVCDHFLQALVDRPPKHLQNILSANLCKCPPDVEAALLRIARVRKDRSDHVDLMIEHICFLTDVNKLYDSALGLYDLELTLLIAQQSLKDPKEYLPFLRNLQSMSDLRRRYSIDDHLGRYSKALHHLCELDAFDDVKSYVLKHVLYTWALAFYRYQEQKHDELMRLYADFLQAERRFKDAGLAYESLGEHFAASESYRQAHLWEESLSNAAQARMDSQQLHSLATSLSDSLIEAKDYYSAATINLEYLADTPTAARLFCKAYHFSRAERISGLYQRLDLLESVIDPGLRENMGIMTDLLADCKSQLNAQIPRIRELRTKKAEDPLAFWEGDGPGGGVPDDVSIAPTDASTTGGSLFTRYTNQTGTVGTSATRRTSKNRRREERKRARGKKGSVYEEEYLVNSVERLIQRVNDVGEEVSRLVDGLFRRRMREQARSVENAMVEVVGVCQGCVEEVFQPDKSAEQIEDADDGQYRPQGGDSVLLESIQGRKRHREPPLVKGFEQRKMFGG